MAELISERQAAKLALLIHDTFERLGTLAPGEIKTYYRGLSREMADIIREMAKPEPDLAKIEAWTTRMLEDDQESEG